MISKNITYQTTKLQKKTKTGSENENEMRRHVPLPVGITCGWHRLGEGWGYLM